MGNCWGSQVPKPITTPSDLSKGAILDLLLILLNYVSGPDFHEIRFAYFGYPVIVEIPIGLVSLVSNFLSRGRNELTVPLTRVLGIARLRSSAFDICHDSFLLTVKI